MRVYHKPFVTWIWGGCLLMALGGLLALSDRRYRGRAAREDDGRGSRRRSEPSATMNRFLIPLGVFVVLLGFLFVGPRR